jgi:hypothetical protein
VGRCGDAVIEGPVVASWWQGVVSELVGTTRRVPGNKSVGGADRGRWSTARSGWRLGAAARGGVLAGGRVSGNSG